jgi:caffeoyl-CoA O-methyltransferase
MLSKIIRPRRILELGTFTGYSALCLSEGLRDGGNITTIDRDVNSTKLAAEYFSRAGVSEKVLSVHLKSLKNIFRNSNVFLRFKL